jgi:hypothetical protein
LSPEYLSNYCKKRKRAFIKNNPKNDLIGYVCSDRSVALPFVLHERPIYLKNHIHFGFIFAVLILRFLLACLLLCSAACWGVGAGLLLDRGKFCALLPVGIDFDTLEDLQDDPSLGEVTALLLA